MKMFLMVGLPGSGKSSRARVIARDRLAVILSTDDFHHTIVERPDIYAFNPTRTGESHLANQERCRYFLTKGVNVIIDNTNLTNRQIGPYVRMADEYGYEVEFVPCEGDYGSTHDVPADVIAKMKALQEPLSVEAARVAPPI